MVSCPSKLPLLTPSHEEEVPGLSAIIFAYSTTHTLNNKSLQSTPSWISYLLDFTSSFLGPAPPGPRRTTNY
jgi:hypothetical protein